MKKRKKLTRRNKVFLLWLPIGAVLASMVLLVSTQSFLFKGQLPCGCGSLLPEGSGEFEADQTRAYFDNQPVAYPLAELSPILAQIDPQPKVLGTSDNERWVEIDLSEQKLFARQGDHIVYEFSVSTGKPWTPTITGDFRIYLKLRYTKMSGGSQDNGTYYYLPNVPYVQYFSGDYGLHGTYWHRNFGQQMSHGCVNLRTLDAEKLFYWTTPGVSRFENRALASQEDLGTRVIIHE